MIPAISQFLGWAFLFSLQSTTLAFVPRVSSSRTCTTGKQSLGPFLSSSQPSCRTTNLKYSTQESDWEESEWYSPPPAAEAASEQSASEQRAARLPRGVTPKVTVIRSSIDLKKFLQEDDRLCVVRFHAAWCKSCQAFSQKFGKIASQYADWEKQGSIVKENKVRIAEVEWGANTQLCKELGVKKLPSIYFYSSGAKINGFAAGPNKVAVVRDTVKRYSDMTPAELHFEAELEKGKKLMEETARKERFEEVAKARQLRRAASSQSPRGTIRLRE